MATVGGVTTTYAYDRTDELTSQNNGTVTAFASDAFGNMTAKAETDSTLTGYTYDAGNRLTGIDAPGTVNDATFTFDALGRLRTRVVATSPTATTDTYGYVGPSTTVYEIATTGGTTSTTDALIDGAGRDALLTGSTLSWVLFDLHGSTAALESGSRTLTDAYRYDGYGQTVAASGTTANRWRYQGQLDISPVSGISLYAMGARFYAPSLGTFTQLDSIAGSAQDPLSLNRFLYAEANPATLVDPSGHYAVLDDAICPSCVHGTAASISNQNRPRRHVSYRTVEAQNPGGLVRTRAMHGDNRCDRAPLVWATIASAAGLMYPLTTGSPASPMYPLSGSSPASPNNLFGGIVVSLTPAGRGIVAHADWRMATLLLGGGWYSPRKSTG